MSLPDPPFMPTVPVMKGVPKDPADIDIDPPSGVVIDGPISVAGVFGVSGRLEERPWFVLLADFGFAFLKAVMAPMISSSLPVTPKVPPSILIDSQALK